MTAKLLLLLIAHLVLTGLPGVAAALFAARRGVREVPVLLAIGLAASGGVALLAFWAYYGDRLLGETFSYFALFGSVMTVGWALYGGKIDRELLSRLATPLALWALGSGFILFFGFLHGGTGEPLIAATTRFSHALPTDNQIPIFYAEWFFEHGHHGTPPVFPGEWLSSDRPPLQVGYVLSQRAFGWDDGNLNYQVLAVALQQLWIVGLWALLVAARVGRLTRALTMIALLVSDLAIVNGFYVWPKLLPAALLLAAAALVLTPLWDRMRHSLAAAALLAALCGLAMLGHGASVFGVIPLAAVAAFRGLPSLRWVAVALGVGVALMASWSAFQKYDDPPGNRLTKWTLAGVVEIDERGSLETIVDSYREAGIGGTADNKVQNFVTMTGGKPAVDTVDAAVRSGELGGIARTFRSVLFFYLLPSMGLLLLAPLAMAFARDRGRRNPAEWRFALSCFSVFAIGAVAWGLLVFGNVEDRTVLHISSYLLPALGIAGAVAGLRATFPRLAIYVVGLGVLLTLALYAPALDPLPGSSYSVLAAVLSALSLAGFGALALRSRGGLRLTQER